MNLEQIKDRVAPQEADHLTVELERWGGRGPSARDVKDVMDSIKRHVDGIGNVDVEYVRRCRHCGRDPEFDEDGPCCCQKAVVEWKLLCSAEGA